MKRATPQPQPDNREEAERLSDALEAAGIGTWSLDVPANKMSWDERTRELFGLPAHGDFSFEQALQYLHPDDSENIQAAATAALDPVKRALYEVQFRTIATAAGPQRWIYSKGKTYFNEAGIACRFSGTVQDISESMQIRERIAQSEHLAQMALKGANAGFFRINLDTDAMEYSPAFAHILTGDETAKLTRADFVRHIHPADRKLRKQAYAEAERTGRLDYTARVIWNNGAIHWMRATGSYLANSNGKLYLFTGTALDITEETEDRNQKETFNTLIAASHDWMGIATAEGRLSFINTSGMALQGISAAIRDGLFLHDICTDPSWAILRDIAMPALVAAGIWEGRIELRHFRNKKITIPVYLKVTVQKKQGAGSLESIVAVGRDLRGEEAALEALRDNETIFRNVTNSSPTGLWLSDREGNLTYLNKTLAEWTGMPYKDLLGAGWAYAIIDEDRQRSAEAFLGAVAARAHYDVEFRIKKGNGAIIWCRAAGDPYFDAAGQYAGYAGFCMDINDQVAAANSYRESEARFRSIVEQAPMAISLFRSRDMIITIANEAMFRLWGKEPSIIGLPLIKALPELEGQPFLGVLQGVYDTGEPAYGNSTPAKLERDGELTDGYYDFTFTPLRDNKGTISGVMALATEVTEQVIARKQVAETEDALRGAIEIAELATWKMDFEKNEVTYSNRLRDWFGFIDDETFYSTGYNPIQESDQERVTNGIVLALTPEGGGIYDEEYTAKDYRTGQERIIHAMGKVTYNEDGKALKLTGTAQDVTAQRQMQLALERQVQERTEQLQSVNEKLQAANEELFDANRQLTHSNEELAQYAYVASHDLQEPLRKIQMFSGMLGNAALPEEHGLLVSKIGQSAGRMTMLIRDLLDFSRLLKADALMQPVDLNMIVRAVVNDFELSIAEHKAEVIINDLPVIEGVALQMNQLFYNLLSNALKFIHHDRTPQIIVTARPAGSAAVAAYISRPVPHSQYYFITFTDNGIGFEAKYAEQIFEVFKRLHGQDYYPGSGIGLALCRRIVANHGGCLYATSVPGEGTTFHILLPGTQ